MFGFLTKRVTLIGILALVSAISVHYYIKANNVHKIIIPEKSTFYTPGQHGNCKWLVHFSREVTTVSFRVFNSTLMRMVLYSSEEKCVEATMK